MAGPPPHGRIVGNAKFIAGHSIPDGTKEVWFEFQANDIARPQMIHLRLSAEDAEYFQSGQTYALSFTQP